MTQRGLTWCWVIVTSLAMAPAFAAEVRVAMATNFVPPFQEISIAFEQATGHHVQVTAGSSGHLYAQIKNGAPFDVFFSAERERPKLLEEGGFGVKGTRFTYAIGRLVLWSPHADLIKGAETLLSKNYTRLAITNPRNAAYGVAAMQVMQKLRIWEQLQPLHIIVIGESVGQTMEFIESGHAELGFVAISHVRDLKLRGKGSRWEVPPHLHDPIEQDVILLTKGKDNPAAKALMEFMGGPHAKTIIDRYGYGLK